MEKIKNLFHFIAYKGFKVKSDFIKAILFTGITTVLLNGVIDRGRTVAVVVRRVEDVDGVDSIEVGDLDGVLDADGGDDAKGAMGFSCQKILDFLMPEDTGLSHARRYWTCSCQKILDFLVPGSTKDSPPWTFHGAVHLSSSSTPPLLSLSPPNW